MTFAQSFEVDNIAYTITSNPLEVAVTSKTPKYTGDIVIPNHVTYNNTIYTVTRISTGAFYGCENVTSITISNSVREVFFQAFSGCTSITSLEFPNSVQSIAPNAFGNCSSLKSLSFPASMSNIGTCAFYGCISLESISIPSDNQYYTVVDNVLYNKGITSLIKYPSARLCNNYIIPNTVTIIEPYAFNYCNSLTNITIPDNVIEIGQYAFSDTRNLEFVHIGSRVSQIGTHAFSKSEDLKSVIVECKVKSIGSYCFSDCFSLDNVIMGFSVVEIGEYAFKNCTKLLTIICCASGIPELGNDVFTNVPDNLEIFVQYPLEPYFSIADQWSDFTITGTNICASSLNEIENKRYVAYPNPTEGETYIQIQYSDKLMDISLYNMVGERNLVPIEVYQNQIELKTSNLKSGVYIIEVKDKNSILGRTKIIKQ